MEAGGETVSVKWVKAGFLHVQNYFIVELNIVTISAET